MHRFLPGILLLQFITAALAWAASTRMEHGDWWYLAIAALVSALATALWFGTIARHHAAVVLSSWRLRHEAEIHKLKNDVVRDRSRQQEKMHKEVRKVERRAGRRSNVKVGIAFAAVASMGVVMLLTELFTLGLLTITSAGSALGGYLMHWRQSKARPAIEVLPADLPKMPKAASPSRAESSAGSTPGTNAGTNAGKTPVLTLHHHTDRSRG